MPPLHAAPPHPSLTHLRLLHQTSPVLSKSTRLRLAHIHANIPPYPYGPSPIYKQSNFGLYGLSKIRFGNMVSSRNEIKTRRFWRPNVQMKKLWSEALGVWVRTRVTTRVLRTVDKVGGLDEYLLGGKQARIKELGMGGWALRWRVLQTAKVQERLRRERDALGLGSTASEDVMLVGVKGNLVGEEEAKREVEAFDKELERGAVVGIGGEEELTQIRVGGEEGAATEEFMKEEEPGRRALL